MADDFQYIPQAEQPEPSALQKLWNARPWQGYAENPPSMLPQLGMALGLLHPSLGRMPRDVGMARALMDKGNTPAITQMPSTRFAQEPPTGVITNTMQPGAVGNSNAPAVMAPGRGPIMPTPGNANAPRATQPSQPGSMAAYEQYLNTLPQGQSPLSYWQFKDLF
jgi:hypothetical protein